MPKHAKRTPQKRVLDLSAAPAPKAVPPNTLSDRQLAEYQASLAGLQRWLPKLRRASNEVGKYQRKITYYEKLVKR